MKRKLSAGMLGIILLACLLSCAGFEQNTYRTLYIAGTTYDVAMRSVSDFQKQGKITEAQRIEINKIGNIYYVAYQSACDFFAIWKQTQTAESKLKVQTALKEVNGRWPSFAEYINRIKPGTVPAKLEEVK